MSKIICCLSEVSKPQASEVQASRTATELSESKSAALSSPAWTCKGRSSERERESRVRGVCSEAMPY